MHQPTNRVLKILEQVASHREGQRLSDFSKALGFPKSTMLPILQTLCENRYLNQDETGRYTAGTALFSLGVAFSGCFPVLEFVRQQLSRLVEQLGETCYCGVLEDGQVLYLDKVDSPQPLRMLTNTGRRLPAYATSIGKALLIGKTEKQLKDMYPAGLEGLTSHTITDFSTLAQQVQQAQLDGYTWEIEESTEHIRCFAVPVYKNGEVIAAVSVAIPLFRYQETEKDRILELLKLSAAEMGSVIEVTDAHFGSAF